MPNPLITVSIVSHRQGQLVGALLADLAKWSAAEVEVVLTLNVPEPLPFDAAAFSFPIRVIANDKPRGFGANHNRAFVQSHGAYFCVLNPDIRLIDDVFPPLLQALDDERIGVAGPLVVNLTGDMENSARRFPTLASILRKAFLRHMPIEYTMERRPIEPDWIAGMFMLFRASTFGMLGGFDEGYFLYYEDVDLCARLRARGLRVLVEPRARVIHDADRRSWRNVYYTSVHARSLLRFLRADPKRARAALIRSAEDRVAEDPSPSRS